MKKIFKIIINKVFMLKNIVLSGGGIKLFYHLGFIEYLEKENILLNIEHYSGSSIGSFLILLLILEFKSKELKDIFMKLNYFKSLNIDVDNILNYFCCMGIDDSNNLKKIIEIILEKKGYDKNITMLELYEKTNKTLNICVSNITSAESEIINHETFPNFNLVYAVAISCSVPFYFTPKVIDKNIYIDGGLYNNYPINIFDNDIENTIGCNILTSNNKKYEIDDIFSYLMSMMYSLSDKLSIIESKKYSKNTVSIESKYNALEINITYENKLEMIEVGFNSTKEYFEKINNS